MIERYCVICFVEKESSKKDEKKIRKNLLIQK